MWMYLKKKSSGFALLRTRLGIGVKSKDFKKVAALMKNKAHLTFMPIGGGLLQAIRAKAQSSALPFLRKGRIIILCF
jgi:hypothetical protein